MRQFLNESKGVFTAREAQQASADMRPFGAFHSIVRRMSSTACQPSQQAVSYGVVLSRFHREKCMQTRPLITPSERLA